MQTYLTVLQKVWKYFQSAIALIKENYIMLRFILNMHCKLGKFMEMKEQESTY